MPRRKLLEIISEERDMRNQRGRKQQSNRVSASEERRKRE